MPVRGVLVFALRLCSVAASCFPDGDYVADDLGSVCHTKTGCDGPTCCCYRQKNCVSGACECGAEHTVNSNCFDCSPGYYGSNTCTPCDHCDREGTQLNGVYSAEFGWPTVKCDRLLGTCHCNFGWTGSRCELQDSPPSPPGAPPTSPPPPPPPSPPPPVLPSKPPPSLPPPPSVPPPGFPPYRPPLPTTKPPPPPAIPPPRSPPPYMSAGCMARLGGARSTCEECSACSMLWCSVSLQCFCDGDGACGGELLADSHMELIERNRGITSWCPDAWSSCASTEVGCQSQERTEDCGLCRAKAACSWCLYSDAVDATASMCIFNGDSGGQARRRYSCAFDSPPPTSSPQAPPPPAPARPPSPPPSPPLPPHIPQPLQPPPAPSPSPTC